VVERQQALLYQAVAESVARGVSEKLAEQRQQFIQRVETLMQTNAPRDLAARFDASLRPDWPLAEIGFAVSLEGKVLAPSLFDSPEARRFRLDNDRFLCSGELVEVYWSSPKYQPGITPLDPMDLAPKSSPTNFSKAGIEGKATKARVTTPEKYSPAEIPMRQLTPEEAEFQRIVTEATEGTLARFLQNQLKLLFWYRPPRDPQLVFGAQVNLARLVGQLKSVVQLERALRGEICVALLDDNGRPVAQSQADFVPSPIHGATAGNPSNGETRAGWKRPFVATEIGEALPHWEIAVYLLNPAQLGRSAGIARVAVTLLTVLLVLAIAVGSWLIVADLRRQLALARQKTDFVSNVSHELKTPLTSIRMFSEMLAEGRVQDDDKRRHFLGIITAETARLTRLINNVLDFSRIERGEKKYQFEPCDIVGLTRDTVESYRPHLEANGFTLKLDPPASPVNVPVDRDALAQVLVNLLSNAEKYSGERRTIEVRVETKDESISIKVLDRGPGVPRGSEERIFEQFYRAHDSLASGVQGSGLGLTLARQIARAHGGDVTWEARDGGGSCFTITLPKETRDATNHSR
jgi:signal transduction histidine kinase